MAALARVLPLALLMLGIASGAVWLWRVSEGLKRRNYRVLIVGCYALAVVVILVLASRG